MIYVLFFTLAILNSITTLFFVRIVKEQEERLTDEIRYNEKMQDVINEIAKEGAKKNGGKEYLWFWREKRRGN